MQKRPVASAWLILAQEPLTNPPGSGLFPTCIRLRKSKQVNYDGGS
jgi:hypothetical protein